MTFVDIAVLNSSNRPQCYDTLCVSYAVLCDTETIGAYMKTLTMLVCCCCTCALLIHDAVNMNHTNGHHPFNSVYDGFCRREVLCGTFWINDIFEGWLLKIHENGCNAERIKIQFTTQLFSLMRSGNTWIISIIYFANSYNSLWILSFSLRSNIWPSS